MYVEMSSQMKKEIARRCMGLGAGSRGKDIKRSLGWKETENKVLRFPFNLPQHKHKNKTIRKTTISFCFEGRA